VRLRRHPPDRAARHVALAGRHGDPLIDDAPMMNKLVDDGVDG
jgi:hypothetical protein